MQTETEKCICRAGVRCPVAEQLWRERSLALSLYQVWATKENMERYRAADDTFWRHVIAAQKMRKEGK